MTAFDHSLLSGKCDCIVINSDFLISRETRLALLRD